MCIYDRAYVFTAAWKLHDLVLRLLPVELPWSIFPCVTIFTYNICNMYSNTVFLVCIHFYGVCCIVFSTDGSFLYYSCDQFSTNKLYQDPGGREASVIMGTRFGIPNDAVRASHFARHHLYIVTSRRRSNDLFERFWTLNQVLQSRLRWHSCHRLQVPRSVDSQSLGVQNNQNNSMYVSCAVHEQHFVLYTSFSQR